MTLDEIKEFLREKPGYLKEGKHRLRNILRNRGQSPTLYNCEEALKAIYKEQSSDIKQQRHKSEKILIYDIETSPNIGWFWRSGYNQTITHEQIIKERAIICVSYKWINKEEVYNLVWDNNQDDKFLLEQFIPVLNEADMIVAHHGDSFDIKWIRTRAVIQGIEVLPHYVQFDTRKIAKAKCYFNSNKLDYIAQVLGYEGKIKTDVQLWKDVCLKNDRDALQKMLDYCDEDVRQLEKVYNVLKYADYPKMHVGVLNGEVKATSPINGTYNVEHIKEVTTARGTIKHIMKDLETGRHFEMSDTNYKKLNIIK